MSGLDPEQRKGWGEAEAEGRGKKAVGVSVAQSWLTLWGPMDDSPLPVSSVHGILQVGILEWVAAVHSPRGSSRPRDQTRVSNIASRFFTV